MPSVVIAGNHDHPTRLDTWGLLAEFVGVQARGLPRRRQDGGLIELPTRGGETALVAALPWAPPGRIVEALTLASDQTLARQQYAEAVQQMLAQLAEGFRPDAVNLVVAHSHIAGAKGSGSERVATHGRRVGGDGAVAADDGAVRGAGAHSPPAAGDGGRRRTPSLPGRRCSSISAR